MTADERRGGPVDPGMGSESWSSSAPPTDPIPAGRGDSRLRGVGRGGARVAAAAGRGLRASGRVTGRGARAVYGKARRASHADGAGESGLFRIVELAAVNAAGDAAVAISLAGTLFFQVPTGQARGQVALFLLLTMLPFVVVAPFVGPFLDRFSHGRRWAIGATTALRAWLCWVLAGAVVDGGASLFPAALGCLVASKAYSVTRAAAVPRLTPRELSLVKANSRINIAGVVGTAVAGPLTFAASKLGPEWSLRLGFAIFVLATIMAILLPQEVDNSDGERAPKEGIIEALRRPMPGAVAMALRANLGLRLLSGLLLLYLAFILRDHPFESWKQSVPLLIGAVAGAAGVGNTIGVAIGAVLKKVSPEGASRVSVLVATLATAVGAFMFTLPVLLAVAFVAGFAQAFAKLALDALIQRDVPDLTRASTFARSETLLQVGWVVGGFIGIVMPMNPAWGLGIGAIVMVAATVWAFLPAKVRAESHRATSHP